MEFTQKIYKYHKFNDTNRKYSKFIELHLKNQDDFIEDLESKIVDWSDKNSISRVKDYYPYPKISIIDKKYLAVFGIYDRLYRRTDNFNIVFFENPLPEKVHTTIEGSLATKCEQYPVWFLLLDHFLDKIGSDWQEVDLVSDLFGSLDRSDIRVDQDCENALFF